MRKKMVDVNTSKKILYKELHFIEDYIKQFKHHTLLDHNQSKLLMESYKNIELVRYSLEEDKID